MKFNRYAIVNEPHMENPYLQMSSIIRIGPTNPQSQ